MPQARTTRSMARIFQEDKRKNEEIEQVLNKPTKKLKVQMS